MKRSCQHRSLFGSAHQRSKPRRAQRKLLQLFIWSLGALTVPSSIYGFYVLSKPLNPIVFTVLDSLRRSNVNIDRQLKQGTSLCTRLRCIPYTSNVNGGNSSASRACLYRAHRPVDAFFKIRVQARCSLRLPCTPHLFLHSLLSSRVIMKFTVATLFVSALTASAGIVALPSVPRALGDVIVLQPPQGYVVRAGEAFPLHYINKV